eukprot:COSAG02_NODE_4893_length_4853_cov_10.862221_5_plen_91_part_00
MLEQQRVAAESAEAHAKSEWEKVEAESRAKFAQAEAVLDKQLKLLEWEEEQERKIYDRNRAQQEEEKAALLSLLQEQPEQPVANSYTSPA